MQFLVRNEDLYVLRNFAVLKAFQDAGSHPNCKHVLLKSQTSYSHVFSTIKM